MRRDVFQAIADPTRREIIGLVSHHSRNVNELADNFEMSRPAVSKHVRILKECGLVTIEKKGRERYCHAQLDKLGEIALWVHQYRRFWNASLDTLEALLKEDSNKK
ncbi:metalloregulator ArsR/SmtB family transcription factor [Ekhidna sp.]|uniref:ArsR/SmtB family transcription factor n=1 Tax=Ekhidna sp. TaxID=2608089 RepID=UPI003297630C